MRPFRFGFHVNHDKATHPELSRHAECQLLTPNLADVHDAVVTEVSPGCRDCSAAKGVIDDLAGRAGKLVDRIGPRLSVDPHTDH